MLLHSRGHELIYRSFLTFSRRGVSASRTGIDLPLAEIARCDQARHFVGPPGLVRCWLHQCVSLRPKTLV